MLWQYYATSDALSIYIDVRELTQVQKECSRVPCLVIMMSMQPSRTGSDGQPSISLVCQLGWSSASWTTRRAKSARFHRREFDVLHGPGMVHAVVLALNSSLRLVPGFVYGSMASESPGPLRRR